MENTSIRRILLIAGEYPPYMFGGGATFMYHLSRGLSKKGFNVSVVALKLAPRLATEIYIENVDSKLKVIRISIPSFAYPRHEFFQLRARHIVSKLIRTHNIIHMNTGLYYPWLRSIIKHSNKPTVITIHGDPISVLKISLSHPVTTYGNKIYDLLYMIEVRQALRKEVEELYPVFVSKSVYETLKNVFNIMHYSIVYNGIDFDYINSALKSRSHSTLYNMIYSAKKRGFRILIYVARFHPIKNHIALLPLLHHLIKRGVKVLLVLIGEGPLKNFIQQKATRMNISQFIVFTGVLPNDEVLRLLSLADLVVFPSLYEAHPISVIEALYLNKPVITFDLLYVRELYEVCKELQLVKTVNNFSMFISKTFEMLTSNRDFDHNLNIKTHECLLEKFGVNNMVRSYIELYNRINLENQ